MLTGTGTNKAYLGNQLKGLTDVTLDLRDKKKKLLVAIFHDLAYVTVGTSRLNVKSIIIYNYSNQQHYHLIIQRKSN